jgi:hypothetical protein
MTPTKPITMAAREHLVAMGLHQRGRSRLWYDDCGWYLINVEFQPFRNPGTGLNVGAMWLWNDRDHWAFDDGGRVYWRADGSSSYTWPPGEPGWTYFVDFHESERFARDVQLVARIAAEQVVRLRELFASPSAASAHLTSRPTRVGESRWWHWFNSGAAAGLAGDASTARRCFEAIAVDSSEPGWAQDLARRANELRELSADQLRAGLVETIHSTRQRLRLPPLSL